MINSLASKYLINLGHLLLVMPLAFFALPAKAQAPSFDLHSIQTLDDQGESGRENSLALDADGYPVVAYSFKPNATSSQQELRIVRCVDVNCADTKVIRSLDQGQVLSGISLALDESSFPVITYLMKQATGNTELKILRCNDRFCYGNNETIENLGSAELWETALALDSDDNPVVSYTSKLNLDTRNRVILLHCDDPHCAPDSSGNPETGQIVDLGSAVALQLDASGFPVIAYQGSSYGLLSSSGPTLAHCNDTHCEGTNESVEKIGYSYYGTGYGIHEMVLDAAGNPTMLVQKGSNGFIHRCNNPDCAADDEIISQVHNDGMPGDQLQLDSDGIPVITTHSWYAKSGLLVMRCDTPNCDVYLDTSRWVTDTYGSISGDTSLALDVDGYPVISYYSGSSGVLGELRLLHCGDKPCTAYWRVVGLDFEPDNANNTVNTDGPDGFEDIDFQVEFAVLGETDFDVTAIDSSVMFVYRGGYSQRARPIDPEGVIEDVNNDGFPDRTFTFWYRDIPLPWCRFGYGPRRMDMRANLYSGEQIWGWDDLKANLAPCKIDFSVNPYTYGVVHPHHNGLCWLNGCDNQDDVIRVDYWNTEGISAANLKLGPLRASILPDGPHLIPDQDGDGYPEGLYAEYLTGDTGITCTDTEVLIYGETSGGEPRVGKSPIAPDCDAGAHCH